MIAKGKLNVRKLEEEKFTVEELIDKYKRKGKEFEALWNFENYTFELKINKKLGNVLINYIRFKFGDCKNLPMTKVPLEVEQQ